VIIIGSIHTATRPILQQNTAEPKPFVKSRQGSVYWSLQPIAATTAIFGDLCGYIFGNVRDKTSNIRPTWRYATPCRPL